MTDIAAEPIIRVKARKHFSISRWVSAAILLLIAALLIRTFATNANMRWGDVAKFFFNNQVLVGVRVTVELTAISQAIAIVLGFILALFQQSHNPVAVAFARIYIWLFRAVPLIVQLLFWYNIAILIPRVALHIPWTHVGFAVSSNRLISGFTAAILGLGLNESAYMAEIVRAGTLSVPRGQVDAALSIGMKRGEAMRRIVLPQTLRVIIPPTGNQFIGLLKASALVSVIGGGDLLTRVEYIYGQNFLVIPLLIVATIWYVILVTIFSIFQHFLEVRQSASLANAPPPSLYQRVWSNLGPRLHRST